MGVPFCFRMFQMTRPSEIPGRADPQRFLTLMCFSAPLVRAKSRPRRSRQVGTAEGRMVGCTRTTAVKPPHYEPLGAIFAATLLNVALALVPIA
jgi:hypothetical protein